MKVVGEKRSNFRLKIRTPVYFKARGQNQSDNTLSRDISLRGLGLISNSFLLPSTMLMLEINLLAKILRPIGRVAWSAPLPHSNRYLTGIEFVEFDLQEKRYLNDYIDMQTGKI